MLSTRNYLRHGHRLSIERLSLLRNSQTGTDVVIALPGPSLQRLGSSLDLDKAKTCVVAVNFARDALTPQEWKHAYSYASDEWRIQQLSENQPKHSWDNVRVLKILSKHTWPVDVTFSDKDVWIRGVNIPASRRLNWAPFSVDLGRIIYLTGGTSLFGAVQFAAWIGARSIQLIGADFGINDKGITHGVHTPVWSTEVRSDEVWEAKWKNKISPALQRYRTLLHRKAVSLSNMSQTSRDTW